MNNLIFSNRRGVSEIITTMMLLVITVAGAVIFSNFVHDGFFQINQNPSSESNIDSIQLTGYDTRDSVALIDIVSLDNDFNQMLCTSGDSSECSVTALTADNIPSNSGTEFIVLKIRNMNVNSIFLQSILINDIEHTWDDTTKNNVFDGSVTGVPGVTYPKAGKFSIIPTAEKPNPLKQKETNELRGDEEVRVIIKLSNNISQDIKMWKSIRVLVNFGNPNLAEFIVSSGDAKW